MFRSTIVRALRRSLALALLAAACRRSEDAAAAMPPIDGIAVANVAAPAAALADAAPVAFTAADLAGYERGIAAEAELVRAAQARGRAATTPAERGAAAQGEWEDATIPGGAQAAAMSVARYRQVRTAVNRVLQTLDFQGKIAGPQEIDTVNAAPELRRRLTSDPFAELAPASAAALRARLDQVVQAYVAYMTLTAVNG
jgi:hypothetical protein